MNIPKSERAGLKPEKTLPIQVIGIAGSLRTQSYNRALLRAVQEVAPAEINLTILDLTRFLSITLMWRLKAILSRCSH